MPGEEKLALEGLVADPVRGRDEYVLDPGHRPAGGLAQFGVGSEVMDAPSIQRRFPAMETAPCPVFCPDTGEVVERDWGELWARATSDAR